MGYEKEIILIKDTKSAEFSALDLLKVLSWSEWNETLSLIDRGDDFNWIEVKDKIEFIEILKDKTLNKEYIGFTIQHQTNKRFVTVNMDETTITFSLDIRRKENEEEWFSWYQNHLISKLKMIIKRVEWKSNYNNEIIKLIDKESI
ncbi:hypothetical protein [Flammeovirga sp. EKP202]|uniref:hypothetical protein n=1 Tax=Flammeovirga sp. EKP202 TaxID=2770592 RepID=UPI00165FCD80|nr:hypothetical protein [Flammeovirga sp. EKP202]MBD0404134.1 hypothetical protein [Flammeovirga sp. EKP202]